MNKIEMTSPSNGIGGALIILATVALVVLKVTGILAISWWVVFLPLIIAAGIVALFLLIFLAFLIFFHP